MVVTYAVQLEDGRVASRLQLWYSIQALGGRRFYDFGVKRIRELPPDGPGGPQFFSLRAGLRYAGTRSIAPYDEGPVHLFVGTPGWSALFPDGQYVACIRDAERPDAVLALLSLTVGPAAAANLDGFTPEEGLAAPGATAPVGPRTRGLEL